MPISPTFPGVYIDELPSAVRTIIGVPTSVAAFVGTAPRGATDRPVHISSFAEYEQEFGGLAIGSDLAYAVYQFYLNGGSEAEIVRVVRDRAPEGADPGQLAGTATAERAGADPAKKVLFHADSPGSWANDHLRIRVDYDTAQRPANPGDRTTYNLTVFDSSTRVTERYLNISTSTASADALATRLGSSRLIGSVEGDDTLPAAHADIPVGANPFQDGHGSGDDAWFTAAAGGVDGDPPEAFQFLGGTDGQQNKEGLYQLLKTDIFNMLCLPGDLGLPGTTSNIVAQAAELCLKRRAMLILDPPKAWTSVSASVDKARAGLPVAGDPGRNAAIYFPRLRFPDPLLSNAVRDFPPCGAVAGVWARTDVARGVWKAPAGTAATLNGAIAPEIPMTDEENGRLNPLGVNCLRQFPVVGNVVWGSRTAVGADLLADQWKYLPVRRLALFVEESLFRGTQWVVFEPNDEPLWSSIRLNVGAFMTNLFRLGAFAGRTQAEAYLVKCDATNNPQNDIDRGIVNILVGFAPLKPAEFVVIQIQQLAGQVQV
jgi:phage tail sheath protein FI